MVIKTTDAVLGILPLSIQRFSVCSCPFTAMTHFINICPGSYTNLEASGLDDTTDCSCVTLWDNYVSLNCASGLCVTGLNSPKLSVASSVNPRFPACGSNVGCDGIAFTMRDVVAALGTPSNLNLDGFMAEFKVAFPAAEANDIQLNSVLRSLLANRLVYLEQTAFGLSSGATIGSDVNNCGFPGVVCGTRANAVVGCNLGVCNLTCNAGFADCNGVFSDGCEVSCSFLFRMSLLV
jgi:hypothetical protein